MQINLKATRRIDGAKKATLFTHSRARTERFVVTRSGIQSYVSTVRCAYGGTTSLKLMGYGRTACDETFSSYLRISLCPLHDSTRQKLSRSKPVVDVARDALCCVHTRPQLVWKKNCSVYQLSIYSSHARTVRHWLIIDNEF